MQWLATDERELDGLAGDGFLQGVLLSELSLPRPTTATERRIVMLDRERPGVVWLEVPWSSVRGYWTGTVPFPPELWRTGAEGHVVVLCLDPAAAAGQDLVVRADVDAWVAAIRARGVSRVTD